MAAHPSLKFFGIAKLFLIFALIATLIAIFLPAWSRIEGAGITPLLGVLPYSHSSITSESILYMGLWQWCIYYGDANNGHTCGNTRPSGVPAYGNEKCKGYFLATQVTACLALVFIFFALVASLLAIKKAATWRPDTFFKAPTGPTAGAILCTLLALGLAIAAWACWLVLAEERCHSMTSLWNPFQGYSASFILMCIASGFVLMALPLLFLALKALKKKYAVQETPKQDYPEVVQYVEQATYPVTTYPDASYAQPTTQYIQSPVY